MNITAQYRDYSLRCDERANALVLVDIDKTEYFLLIDTTHYLLIDATHKLYLSDATLGVSTLGIRAQHRDYLLTAEQEDRD